MRHGASLLASLEGMGRTAYRVGLELSNNSRSGLTTRFLSKKLEIPEEEIEYLIDINPKLFFTDITKIRLGPEGHSAIKRIEAGLENRGDVPSMFVLAKSMSASDFRRIEELVGIEEPVTKKQAIEALLAGHYAHPDSVVSYVTSREFSDTAREVFDVLWQSKQGIMPVSQLRVAHGGTEFVVEQALWELFRGLACFELFRFDAEERLVRMAALLSEIRQARDYGAKMRQARMRLKPARGKPGQVRENGVGFADTICRLVAAVAARPPRLRGDGELFREDRKRLAEICPEEDDPSLNTCLWVAEGAGWLVRVDNALAAGDIEPLVNLERVDRLRVLSEWLFEQGDVADARHLFVSLLDELEPGAWYSALEFIQFAVNQSSEHEQPVLKPAGAHWHYVSPSTSGKLESRFARALEETFFWTGLVDRGVLDGESVLRVSALGAALLKGQELGAVRKLFPQRPGEFVVQPNFDVVVPAREMDPLMTVPLDQFAERVSTGHALVYHVSKDSFTHAVQEGHDAGAFVEFLLRHNRDGELPANVLHTLEDWRGGIKRVRLRTVHVLESTEPLVMADLLHRKKLARYFQAIDSGQIVRYSGISKAELAKMLEKDGFVVE